MLSATAKGWMIIGGFTAVSVAAYPLTIWVLSDDKVEEQTQEDEFIRDSASMLDNQGKSSEACVLRDAATIMDTEF